MPPTNTRTWMVITVRTDTEWWGAYRKQREMALYGIPVFLDHRYPPSEARPKKETPNATR